MTAAGASPVANSCFHHSSAASDMPNWTVLSGSTIRGFSPHRRSGISGEI
eukprot:CAMPEP_0204489290 /NCGR_PEP_ID=MMETSP0471-20130131/71865_1 /ASSEMBLY_ACC=CAM_ASM_000602 /TAXON_ID=2969 /ORGANISM="Oxyrrhis marina" /LENGTH=49 /DNA_ID=CAMNT_0051493139 /DNA_START=287 /DNA_END=436 /DNA_ORIENTATION=+